VKTTLAPVLGVALLAMPVRAAELPKTFLGGWTKYQSTADGPVLVGGIYVSPRTYHEPGYNCTIRAVTPKENKGSPDLVYVMDMACSGDSEGSVDKKAREIWALRKIDGKEVLIMAGIAGASYPSIETLQRGE
jgi:hypothetical protein